MRRLLGAVLMLRRGKGGGAGGRGRGWVCVGGGRGGGGTPNTPPTLRRRKSTEFMLANFHFSSSSWVPALYGAAEGCGRPHPIIPPPAGTQQLDELMNRQTCQARIERVSQYS